MYEQRGADWVQRGLIGLVGVGTDAVLPHEGVMAGPVAGRRELMKATQSNLEPILLVYNGGTGAGGHGGRSGLPGPGDASRLTDLTADRQAPLACAVTDDGVSHRLWAVTDPDAQAAIIADLATRTALIADGHHRYAAYRELRAEERDAGEGPGPWDYGLAFLVDADEYPLRLGAIHRVLPRLSLAEAVRLASGAFTVTAVTEEAAFGRLAAAGKSGTAFLLAGKDGYWLLTDPDQRQLEAAMPPAASPRWRELDASVMQELLLARLWSIKGQRARRADLARRRRGRPHGGGLRRDSGHLQPDAAGRRDGHRGARREGAPQVHVLRPEAAHRPGPAHFRRLTNS